MNQPLGLFVTLSAYGHRLHGDEQGTVDRDHNGYGEPLLVENHGRRAYEMARMNFEPTRFAEDLRECIESAVLDACTFRGWDLVAVNCRTNHLHAVVLGELERDRALAALKDRCTRAARAAGLLEQGQPLWARGGSGRYLWNATDVEGASVYTRKGQGGPLPGTQMWKESSRGEGSIADAGHLSSAATSERFRTRP